MQRNDYDLAVFKENLVSKLIRYMKSRCYSYNDPAIFLTDYDNNKVYIFSSYADPSNLKLTNARLRLARTAIDGIRAATTLNQIEDLIRKYKLENAQASATHGKTHNNHFKPRLFGGSDLAEVFHQCESEVAKKIVKCGEKKTSTPG